MKRNILLLEPNYKNKYPPIGLMKIATYHRKLGDNVHFYKGDLKEFLLIQATDLCINKLIGIDPQLDWVEKKETVYLYIKTRKKHLIEELDINSSQHYDLIILWLNHYKDYIWKKEYINTPIWDRVYITTLFTFYWDVTIDTILLAKNLVKEMNGLFVGGVSATILSEEIEVATGIKPWKGLLNQPGILDEGNEDIVDDLPLDYSILDEIDYKYPESEGYYGYMTRGCVRKCPFCAVPILEPYFNKYLSLKDKIEQTKELYGEKRNLLLLDNNVLASKDFKYIIEEIKECGFIKNAKFIEPNQLDIAVCNLVNNINNDAYIKKSYNHLMELLKKAKGDNQNYIYDILKKEKLLKLNTCTKEKIIEVYPEIRDLYEKYRNKSPKLRYVDFNQGVDARLLTEEKIELLSQIPIHPLRIAFDSLDVKEPYIQAIKLGAKYGITHFSNYLLYNFKDSPYDLYKRFRINIDLCDELDVSIYSFPMKYHPIFGKDSHNRDFIGENWNRKFIRSVQAVLNATKGKIGRGTSFFERAFGKNQQEYSELLHMPETYILYRLFFEYYGFTDLWRKEFSMLSGKSKETALKIIYLNDFNNIRSLTTDTQIINLLKHYTNYRKEIITPGTELFKLKQMFDKDYLLEKEVDSGNIINK